MQLIRPYISIARPDHWFKNVFIFPGIVLAFFDSPAVIEWSVVPKIMLALLSACLLASSNYVINEILDAPTDSFHPKKKLRPIPSGKVKLSVAYFEWLFLGLVGLSIAFLINSKFFMCSCFFLFMGLVYNVPPIRLKDIPYLDVLSESVNNPIRLLLGWYSVGNEHVIMLSMVISYWMLGAFLMTVKRYAEYCYIGKKKTATTYRKSFNYYSKHNLLISIIYYATAFGLFSGIFIARYHIELILSVPFVAGFMAYYLALGFSENSPTQNPEKLYKIKGFMIYTVCCFFLIVFFLFVNIPFITGMFSPHYK